MRLRLGLTTDAWLHFRRFHFRRFRRIRRFDRRRRSRTRRVTLIPKREKKVVKSIVFQNVFKFQTKPLAAYPFGNTNIIITK